jgi:hypothetical protein
MKKTALTDPQQPRLIAAAMLWLIAGGTLLLTTLVPMRSDLLGWTPAFWLLGAPLIVLLSLQPSLPRTLLRHRPRRRAAAALVWH